MVIQGYNVNVSSQRTFLSVQSATMAAIGSVHNAQAAGGTTGQGGSTGTITGQNSGSNAGNNTGNNANTGVGQTQNSGNNGQTGPGNPNSTGNNANTGVGQTKNSGNNGQVASGQGQNVSNQEQNNGDVFRTMLKNAREEGLERVARGTRASRAIHAHSPKIPTTPTQLRARLSQMIYELLSGRFSTQKLKEQQPPEGFQLGRSFDISAFFGGAFNLEAVQRTQGIWSIESFEYESEEVSYQASGIIHTADGKVITVDINMSMSREFTSFMSISGNGQLPIDPLVINYGGTAASLTGETFSFDLSMNGELDKLAVLGEGSGFLAIDWNGDGIINDGSELFGPTTGCGFSELRKYDTDGNGWIDSGDDIFDKLVVWSRDKDGNDKVYTLKELGIGAIFLGDISTEFSFKDENNDTLGVMRSTSFFLKYCGGAGTLSHIDMVLQQ